MYNSSFSGNPVTVVTGLSSPADIFYNTVSDTLAIPNSGNNTVTYYGFSTTGIHEMNYAVKVFPSMVNEYLSVESEFSACRYMISDAHGQPVSSGFLYDKNSMIRTSELNAGIYYLILWQDRKSILRKFVKL
jgi:hypothetical protein